MSDTPTTEHDKPLRAGTAGNKPAKPKKTAEQRIRETEARLQQLKAQEAQKRRREANRKRRAEKREQLKTALTLTREEDAHRKIALGGVVIAAGMDHLDPAELCGLLLAAKGNLTPEKKAALREAGLRHFEARKNTRKGK